MCLWGPSGRQVNIWPGIGLVFPINAGPYMWRHIMPFSVNQRIIKIRFPGKEILSHRQLKIVDNQPWETKNEGFEETKPSVVDLPVDGCTS